MAAINLKDTPELIQLVRLEEGEDAELALRELLALPPEQAQPTCVTAARDALRELLALPPEQAQPPLVTTVARQRRLLCLPLADRRVRPSCGGRSCCAGSTTSSSAAAACTRLSPTSARTSRTPPRTPYVTAM